jgi:hypothetical protein
MEYADVILGGCSEEHCALLDGIQYESARIVTGTIRETRRDNFLKELCWEDLKSRRLIHN